MAGDPSASSKRVKVIGDGYEAPYLVPGPSNRILLSLKSGLPTQIDWALSRLVSLTHNHRDQAARDFTLDSVPGLADALLSYVRRIHAALTGEAPSKWASSYFEQPTDAPDAGIGAPGDTGHQGTSTQQRTTNTTFDAALVHRSESVVTSTVSFNPSIDPSHAALMRRSLEAALALRNLTTHASNARSLASVKGVFALIRDVLRLPVTAVQTSGPERIHNEAVHEHEGGWLEMEGIAELRLYFLDILDALAAKVALTRRATDAISASAALTLTTGHATVKQQAEAAKEDASSPGDDIFATLISTVLHSNDRAFLLVSLRCLTAMASVERNEAAFVEVTLPGGQQSPGLLHRCVELLPLTQDTELLEAVLDLLYQLVCIGNNAIKIAAALSSEAGRSRSPSSKEAAQPNGSKKSQSAQTLGVRATAKTAALVRLLSRNLQLGRTMWERMMPLRVPQEWLSSVPNRQFEAIRRRREMQIRIANETPEERSKRKKLTPQERQSLLGLKEPERGIAWMRMVFQRDPESEVTQMEFWTAYKEEFTQQSDGVALQPAGELIRGVSSVFPQAAAMVVPPQNDKPQRFVIRGISIKERDIDLLEPFRCHWSTCPAPETNSLEAQRSHAKMHVTFAADGRCRWKRCNFDATSMGSASEDEQKQALLAHVLTHLTSNDASPDHTKPGRLNIVVDDDLRIVSGATHTGEAAQLVTAKAANGARMLRGKRDSDGAEVALTLGANGRSNAKAKGTVKPAPTSTTPSKGTVDNPGSYTFDVTRTPSAGNDESPSPQGPAFTSILILRMLTRRAASLLQKAGSKQGDQGEDADDAAAIRGQGDEKFGLPLPANFGSSDRSKHAEAGEGDGTAREASGLSLMATEEEDYETTERWAVEAATRLLDAVEGVEDELMHHSSQNDILSSYINETLMELRRRPTAAGQGSQAQVDPTLL